MNCIFALTLLLCLLKFPAAEANKKGDARLLNGPIQSEGNVEVFYEGRWYAVCDDLWDEDDGNIVCQQLGYSGAEFTTRSAYYGISTNPYLLDQMECLGFEKNLLQCSHNDIFVHDCFQGEEAGVKCTGTRDIRNGDVKLNGSDIISQGTVEIYYYGKWYAVCDDRWDMADGEVVCNQLGFSGAISIQYNAFFGMSDEDFLLDEVDCSGDESNLLDCGNEGVFEHNCVPGKEAGVVCQVPEGVGRNGEVRLVNGYYEREGNVEIFYQGTWWAVCDDQWDHTDGDVVCRQLGYYGAHYVTTDAEYGLSTRDFLLDNVQCRGFENELLQCVHNMLNIHDCRRGEEAGVVCYYQNYISYPSPDRASHVNIALTITITLIIVMVCLPLLVGCILLIRKQMRGVPSQPRPNRQTSSNNINNRGPWVTSTSGTPVPHNQPRGTPTMHFTTQPGVSPPPYPTQEHIETIGVNGSPLYPYAPQAPPPLPPPTYDEATKT